MDEQVNHIPLHKLCFVFLHWRSDDFNITHVTAVHLERLTASCSSSPQSLVSRSPLRGRGPWSTGLSGKAARSWTMWPCPPPHCPPLRDGCSDDPLAASVPLTTACPSLSWWVKYRSVSFREKNKHYRKLKQTTSLFAVKHFNGHYNKNDCN